MRCRYVLGEPSELVTLIALASEPYCNCCLVGLLVAGRDYIRRSDKISAAADALAFSPVLEQHMGTVVCTRPSGFLTHDEIRFLCFQSQQDRGGTIVSF
jgi:hypothetical protein